MKKPLYKVLYVQVLAAIVIGVLLGFFFPDIGASMQSPSHSRDLFSPASAGSSSFSLLSGWQPHRPEESRESRRFSPSLL